MKVLVIGSGGREHALVWKIHQSPKVTKIYCAPGSAAINELAQCVAIAPEEIDKLADFAEKEKIDLTVVGPELPLTLGISDLFESRGLKIFGPNKAAAQLEGSKAFAKEILQANNIPTAAFGTFTDQAAANQHVKQHPAPYVIKADGLAGGKGVVISLSINDALTVVDEILVKKVFGEAGKKVVIEEFLEGEEASFMVLTDGQHILPLASSQDHKRVFDNDQGPNTGGMGAYSPAPVVTSTMTERIVDEILKPLLTGLKNRGICYRGVIYVGLMITKNGPKVLEFNARFGDPECQPVMMRLKSDLIPLLEATIEGKLDQVQVEWYENPAVCVVLSAAGYPGPYGKGYEIRGLDKLEHWEKGFVFHAGTAKKDGRWLTTGGRVLGISARGKDIADAAQNAYSAISQITWEGMHYRKDIAGRAINQNLNRRELEVEKNSSAKARVGILMGSDSDLEVMREAQKRLDFFGVPYETRIMSAHRTPDKAAHYAQTAERRGLEVIIAGAGAAAHLAGAIAANTILPVIGIPIDSSSLKGLDALLATVQMPAGIPVATMAIGKPGAANAGIFAAQITARKDPKVAAKLTEFKKELAAGVEERDRKLQGTKQDR